MKSILSLLTAHVAHTYGLVYGFAVIGVAYVFAFLFASWPVTEVATVEAGVSG